MTSVEELEKAFGIPEYLHVKQGNGGLAKVVMTSPVHPLSTLEVYLFGAHVTRWTDSDGQDRLFVSDKAVFDGKKAIRGGVPVIFPQFGPGPLPQHGFARNSLWRLIGTGLSNNDRVVKATFELTSSDATRAVWPHDFRYNITFSLQADGVWRTRIMVENTGKTAFQFHTVLHTYFAVSSARKAEVYGLKGLMFRDITKANELEKETRDAVTFEQLVDRRYVNTDPNNLTLVDPGVGKYHLKRSDNIRDVVTWNPWIDKAKAMSDFGDAEYLRMACVECGVVEAPATLNPGHTWKATHDVLWAQDMLQST